MTRLFFHCFIISIFFIITLDGCKAQTPQGQDIGVSETSSDVFDAEVFECQPGERRCLGNIVQVCKDYVFVDDTTCVSPQICSSVLGSCADCEPGVGICKGSQLYECTDEGIAGEFVETCPDNYCIDGRCTEHPCTYAQNNRSYLGCSYWPTILPNVVQPIFSFAVVVANPQDTRVDVTISTKDNPTFNVFSVAPKSVEVVKLPWIDDLKHGGGVAHPSRIVPGSAYHLTSSLPVAVYQFNPWEFTIKGACANGEDCFSYTNDASLLLPDATFTQKYMVTTVSSYNTIPGMFSVVAVKPGTTYVKVTFSAESDVSPFGLFKKGDTAVFTLSEWDVFEMFSGWPEAPKDMATCYPKGKYDFTGSLIESSQPIAVFVGAKAMYIPCDTPYADHLEEQLFPLETWGNHYIGTNVLSKNDTYPTVYRFVSAVDNNTLTFDPPFQAATTLQTGEFFEVTTKENFEVNGTGPFALTQFMVGQAYVGTATDAISDPAMAMVVPVEQYRRSYSFMAPDSFTQNFVNIVVPAGASATLDGNPISSNDLIPIGTSQNYSVAKMEISGGAHTVESSSRVGISVYGVSRSTSYMYPGGLDLKLIIY